MAAVQLTCPAKVVKILGTVPYTGTKIAGGAKTRQTTKKK
jgi:hypothetical protein